MRVVRLPKRTHDGFVTTCAGQLNRTVSRLCTIAGGSRLEIQRVALSGRLGPGGSFRIQQGRKLLVGVREP